MACCAGRRWRALRSSIGGEPGFSLLPPADTGITFANNLDPHEAASNRVLLNGSGVAIGDFDGTGCLTSTSAPKTGATNFTRTWETFISRM